MLREKGKESNIMEKRILNYRKYIDELLQKEDAEWEQILEQHLVQISFFQHERLIHLIVTVTFALLEMIAIAASVIAFTPMLAVLDILLLVLLIPYVRHYYILENETQKMYAQYDALLRKIENYKGKTKEV